MATKELSAWSADGKPSRWDIVAAVSALALSAIHLSTTREVLWILFGAGFVAFGLLIGPVATSAAGRRMNSRFGDIGPLGRAIAVVGFLVALWTAEPALGIAPIQTSNFLIGGMFALGVVIVAEALRARVSE